MHIRLIEEKLDNDMKDKITIRISASLKEKLAEMSETVKVSVSEIARTILENYFSSNRSLEEQSNINESAKTIQEVARVNQIDATTNLKEEDVVFSREFYQLLIWMYDQKESKKLKLSNDELYSFKDTVNKLQFSSEVPSELKKEFDKVYVDLVRMLTSSYNSYITPDFAYNYGSSSFNFKMLNNFLFPENVTVNLSTFKSFDYD
jgi:hypothetical protein